MSTAFQPNLWADTTLNDMKRNLQIVQRIVNSITDYTKFVKGKEANGYTGLQIGAMKPVALPASESDVNKPAKGTFRFAFDQHVGSPFEVNDIDNAQTNIELLKHFTKDAYEAILDGYDEFIAKGLITGANKKLKKSDTTGNVITKADIQALRLELNKMRAPLRGRYLLVSPEAESQLLDISEFISRDKIADATAMKEGIIGRVLGFDVLMSPLMPKTDTTGAINATAGSNVKDTLVAYHSLAFGFGRQLEFNAISEPKALLPGAIVNIYSVYGGVIQEPKYAVSLRDN